MKQKKSTMFLFVVVLGMMAFGCSKKDESKSAAEPRKASGGKQTFRLGTASPEDAVTHLFAVKFAEEAGVLSSGRIEIQVYPNSTLGGDVELLEQLAAGDIQFVLQTTAPAVDFVPDVAVFDLPCAFSSLDELRNAVNNDQFRRLIGQAYLDAGYRLLAYADQGFREMSTNKPVRALADFRGQKIRTMENRFHLAFWRAIGAAPTPMTFAEVYIGLQQGTIDGQENPYEVIVSGKLYEQQKYVVNTHHVPHMLMLITNDAFYKKLDGEDQNILDEAAGRGAAYAYGQTDIRIADRISIITGSGTEILDLPPDLYREIVTTAAPVYDQIRAEIGNELVDTLLGAK